MPAIRRRWTTADVRTLTDEARAWPRYELIDGELLVTPADLELRADTITQPDVFVIPADTRMAGDRLEWSDVKSLLLAVEVLSPSSDRADRVVKRHFYLESHVGEYWTVDLDARVIERWTPSQASPTILRDRLMWEPAVTSTDPTPHPAMLIDIPALLFSRIDRKVRMFKR